MTVFDKGLITVMSVAALFIGLAIPLVLRKIPPNIVYGFRVAATLRDEKVWYETNDTFGRWLIAASIVSGAGIYLIYTMRWFGAETFMTATIVALAAPVVIATIAGFSRLRSSRQP